ncbi:MAG: hypothetical protein ABJP33_00215 [Pseudoruegeria sp.]
MSSVTSVSAGDGATATSDLSVDGDSPFGELSDLLGDITTTTATDSGSDSIVSLGSAALDLIMMGGAESEVDIAAAMTALFDEIGAQLLQVDHNDPVASEALSTSLSSLKSLALSAGNDTPIEVGNLYGVADTALRVLAAAADDPVMGDLIISDAISAFSEFAADYESVVSGITDLPIVSEATFSNMASFVGMLPTSDTEIDAVSEDLTNVEVEASTSTENEEADVVSDDAVYETSDSTDEVSESSSGNLSTEASPGTETASEDNQEALEARFIALYERLMEKQISFKERVEPFKTDNQNAGKG